MAGAGTKGSHRHPHAPIGQYFHMALQDGNQVVEEQEGRWRGKPTEILTMRRFAIPAVRVMLWPLHGYPVYDVGSRKPKPFPMGGASDEWTTLYKTPFKYMDFAAETTGTVTMRLYQK